MDKKRIILRGILDSMTLWEIADLLSTDAETTDAVERLVSDYVARTIDDVFASNIIADEIGYCEYQRRLKEVE